MRRSDDRVFCVQYAMKASTKREAAPRDWPVAAVAAAGLAISAHLAVAKLAGGQALLCEAGGGCDIVQLSR